VTVYLWIAPTPLTFKCPKYCLSNWVCIRVWWQLSPSQRRTSLIPPINLWFYLCILLSLLGNGSVNTFPWQGGIIYGVVFYAVRVVSGDYFFPELLVIIMLLSLLSLSLSLLFLHTLHTTTMIPTGYHDYRISLAMIAPLPPHQFMRPSCCYYWLQGIRSWEYVVACVCITSVWKFVKLRPVALELKLADIRKTRQSDRRQIWLSLSEFFPYTQCK
jgi:hypothetical protein